MDLHSLIPNTSDENWIIKGDYLMYKKYVHLPIAYIQDDIVHIFLDLKVINQITKMIKHLVKNNIEFYFDSPEFSNPAANTEEYNVKVIKHYLYCHADKNVFYDFKKIGFDLIKNLVDFCEKNNCYESLKPCYEEIKAKVDYSQFDFYTNKKIWDYPEEIRTEFHNLYRDIQINRII